MGKRVKNPSNEFFNAINDLLRELQPICKRVGKRYPQRNKDVYRLIIKPEKRRYKRGSPFDLKTVFLHVAGYQSVFKGMEFIIPPRLIDTDRVKPEEDHEISVIAHYTRRMIGRLTGTWHSGPLDDLASIDLPIEQKRQYILDYIGSFIHQADKFERSIPDSLILEDSWGGTLEFLL